jgi:hypothetical protein
MWTDVVQASAAAVAIIGAFVSVIAYFRRDKRKIASLEAQERAITALRAQASQLESIHQAIAKGLQLQSQNAELAALNRKNEIRPFFVFGAYMRFYGWTNVEYWFDNRGAVATDISVHWLDGPRPLRIEHVPGRVEKTERLKVKCVFAEPLKQDHSFILSYLDSDNSRYQQRTVVQDNRMTVFDPVEPNP